MLLLVLSLMVNVEGWIPQSDWDTDELVQGLRRCNLKSVKFKPRTFSSVLETTQVLAPRKLLTKMSSTLMNRDALFMEQQQLCFSGGELLYFDRCESWKNNTCISEHPNRQQSLRILTFPNQMSQLFQKKSNLLVSEAVNDLAEGDTTYPTSLDMSKMPPVPGSESLSEQPYLFRMFQNQYAEIKIVDFKETRFPSNIVTSKDFKYFAWIENMHPDSNSTNFIRVVQTTSSIGLIPDEKMNGGEVLDRNSERGSVGEASRDLRRSMLAFCGNDHIVYQADKPGVSAILLRSMGTPEDVSTLALQARHPIVYSDSENECVVAWIQSSEDSHEEITVFKHSDQDSHTTNSEWVTGSYDTIIDIALAHGFVYIVSFSEELSMYKLRYALQDSMNEFTDVPNATFGSRIMIHKSSLSSSFLLYTKINDTDSTANQVILHTVDTLKNHHECLLESPELRSEIDDGTTLGEKASKTILQLSVYNDTVVWLAQYNDDPSSQVFELLDLDKDNDGLIDALDAFPYSHRFTADADGDGYPDEADFVWSPMMNDDLYMYAAFGITMFATMMILTLLIKYQTHTERQQMLAASAEELSNDATDISLTGTVFYASRRNTNAKKKSIYGGGKVSPYIRNTQDNIAFSEKQLSGGEHKEYTMTKSEMNLQRMSVLSSVAETVVILLTISSLVLAVIPFLDPQGMRKSSLQMLVWVDLFTMGIFIVDLVVRYSLRNRKEIPSFQRFAYDNWYDFPAILTEIPLTSVTFPEWLSFFKVFRFIRLYRRFTQQAIFVSLMVKRPTLYLGVLLSIIISISAVVLKLCEQHEQPVFESYGNSFWFIIVTVTTVGYGDLKPVTLMGRLYTSFLMLVGIGLISTLSAFTAEMIVGIGKTGAKKDELRAQLINRFKMVKVGLLHISEPYNPLAVVLESIHQKSHKPGSKKNQEEQFNFHIFRAEWAAKGYNTIEKHSSSTLNITKGMKSDILLPIEKIMEGAGGKFRISAVSSQADIIRAVSKETDQEYLLQVLHRGRLKLNETIDEVDKIDGSMKSLANDIAITPRTRLHFLMLRFGFSKTLGNFEELVEEVGDILFEPARQQGIAIEKVFAIQKFQILNPTHLFYSFDCSDPMHEKLVRLDDYLLLYGLTTRVDYNEFFREIQILLLLRERVETVKWAIENLEYKNQSHIPEPVREDIVPPLSNMPQSEIVFFNAETESSAPSRAGTTEKNTRGRRGSVSRTAKRASIF